MQEGSFIRGNLYKEIYNLDDISNISNVFEVNNPTSTFKK